MPKAARVPETSIQPLTIEMLALEQVQESPFNPRKTFTELEDLADDVRRRGVLQPVLVRPTLGGSYQLVFGARRYRAAKLAGLGTIPALVREMSDVEALEVAIIENSKRADVHPLEEADAYRELHEKHGYEVETIAAKVGKSKAAVYARMKLCELGEDGRKAFFEGKLNASTALLLARVPAELQARATEGLLSHSRGEDEPVSFREAAYFLQARFMQNLENAPFDIKDAELVSAAGACGACPKRSGANPDLFGDVDGADVCTDPVCFKLKTETTATRQLSAAAAAGRKVLAEKEGPKALAGGEYVKVKEKCWEDPKHRTWEQLLKKSSDLEVVVAVDTNGAVHELVKRKEAKKALAETGQKWAKDLSGGEGGSYHKNQRDRQKAHKLRGQVVQKALYELGLSVADGKADLGFWCFLAELQLEAAGWEQLNVLGQLHGVKGGDQGAVRRALKKEVESATSSNHGFLRALVVQLLVAGGASGGTWSAGYGRAFSDACKTYGIDFKAIEKKLKAETAAKAPKPKKGKAAA